MHNLSLWNTFSQHGNYSVITRTRASTWTWWTGLLFLTLHSEQRWHEAADFLMWINTVWSSSQQSAHMCVCVYSRCRIELSLLINKENIFSLIIFHLQTSKNNCRSVNWSCLGKQSQIKLNHTYIWNIISIIIKTRTELNELQYSDRNWKLKMDGAAVMAPGLNSNALDFYSQKVPSFLI